MTVVTGPSYARLRSAQACAKEEMELEAFQRMVYASVPVPPAAHAIFGRPDRDDDWKIPGRREIAGRDITYYAIVDDLSSREQPVSVLRRTYLNGGRRDEAFTRDLVWHRSSMLISAERGDLENEFFEITADEANQIMDRIRQSVRDKPAEGPEAGRV